MKKIVLIVFVLLIGCVDMTDDLIDFGITSCQMGCVIYHEEIEGNQTILGDCTSRCEYMTNMLGEG